MTHILNDLYEAENPRFRSLELNHQDDEATPLNVHIRWTALLQDEETDIRIPDYHTYSAIDIPASEKGLLKCGFQLPSILQSPRIFILPEISDQEVQAPSSTLDHYYSSGNCN
jgi:hypothetical protein